MQSARSTALAVLPLGTGNDFAKACSVPLDIEHATRLLAARIGNDTPWRYIDVSRMNDRYLANGADIEFDAQINCIASEIRLPIGQLKYLVAVFQGIWDGVITPEVNLRYDNAIYDGAVTLVEVCNGESVGCRRRSRGRKCARLSVVSTSRRIARRCASSPSGCQDYHPVRGRRCPPVARGVSH